MRWVHAEPDVVLDITVRGDAKTQGSKRAIPNKSGGRVSVVESAKGLPAWREAVRHEAALAHKGAPWRGPVVAIITVTRQRPKSHYRANGIELGSKATPYPTGRTSGDADKLARAVCDALTAAGVWEDDAQVVDLIVHKRWCDRSVAPSARVVVGLVE